MVNWEEYKKRKRSLSKNLTPEEYENKIQEILNDIEESSDEKRY